MTTVNVYSEKPIKMLLSERIEECLNASMTDNRIASYNIPELNNIISACKVNVNVKSHTWNEDGEESVSSSEIALITGLILAFMTYMFVLMYGAMIMGSVVEEKTNRIVEVIVSSCRPIELMLGKILGVALVGLTQIAVWVVLVSIVSLVLGIGSAFSATDMTAGAIPDVPQGEASEIIQAIMGVNWVRLIGIFVLYFIGGYLLYASLFAAFGSAVDQQSDANQYTMPVMMIIIIAMVVGQSCMENPDGQLGSCVLAHSVYIADCDDDKAALRSSRMADCAEPRIALWHRAAPCLPRVTHLPHRHIDVWPQGFVQGYAALAKNNAAVNKS